MPSTETCSWKYDVKSSSESLHVVQSMQRKRAGRESIASAGTSSTDTSFRASSAIARMLNPWTVSQKARVSWLEAVTYIGQEVGSTQPPCARKRSRASITELSIDSKTHAYPIHSERITSTFSIPSGRHVSSISPCSSTILLCSPFASTTERAWWMMSDASTPMTRRAPARAAKSDRMPVPQPTSRTTLPSKAERFLSIAAR
mmetsp:Transcript_61740/g.109380  ORF Transcript_61740/g.109380 Transcript_61740/m.109380 type:complete len:202 (-) Transcript_61740:58-663(-)